jgi:hypothetical protein
LKCLNDEEKLFHSAKGKSFPHSLRRLSVTLGKFPHKKLFFPSPLHFIVSFRILFIILTHSLNVSLPSEINISSLGVVCVCSAFNSSSVECWGKWKFSGKYNVINETWKHDKKERAKAGRNAKRGNLSSLGNQEINWTELSHLSTTIHRSNLVRKAVFPHNKVKPMKG